VSDLKGQEWEIMCLVEYNPFGLGVQSTEQEGMKPDF
jgi:hypothetical protein